ncbi:universal stress protein [Natronobacterium gregoryi]|uniref:Universal stress protein n=2 Tax=Natronobacterium gregoryi TaxID=44930 RepID=L0ALC3_NATGS|nr:universal stress protein [Natronobacterium gregoryi]AFZ74683.1 universal stress protein UspA-like protein [Natronobacterium gregoryi SP2]ELY73412.1 UspA domain-containing protein [Natronobacterium gregoryi SP2]PLK20928.1 universal stress protein [Natronobacterium gregoryi SP2]SFJ04913.1 Nucleotide-binding universal stress protein, UspA family [Natronobacterium gregoryi]
MYDRILVPTDGSPEVERALEYGFDLACAHEATVRILYVVNAASYGGLPMETAWEGISDALYDEGQNAVERARDLAPDDVSVETGVLEGSPNRVIVEEASREDCDLIVMGTHGRGGIDRLLLGSVTERVVRNAPVPVLTVRVDPAEATDKPDAVGTDSADRRITGVDSTDRA